MSASSHEPRLDVTRDADRMVIRFVNCTSLNEYTSDRVGQLLSALALDKSNQQVALDLDNIQYLTSTILGHLLGLHKKLVGGGGHLSLENVRPSVRDVFRVTQLDQVLDIRTLAQPVA